MHPAGICESQTVGLGTRVWAFAHVLPGAVIGADANICDHVFIENDVVIGDRVTVKSGVQLWDGISVGDDVFIGPNASFTNDPHPRSKQTPEVFSRTVIEAGASIGAGAVILPGIRIGRGAMIGAGAVVTRDVPEFAQVVGNPATIQGYLDEHGGRLQSTGAAKSQEDRFVGVLENEFLISLSGVDDMRGSLTVGEFSKFPFVPQRFFSITDVPSKNVRGAHAHRKCEQFLVCLKGSVKATTDDGVNRREYTLDSPRIGLYMPAMTWGTQYAYSEDAVLGVFASHSYDEEDYIRTYEDFVSEVSAN